MIDQTLWLKKDEGCSGIGVAKPGKALWAGRTLPWAYLALRLGLAFLFIYAAGIEAWGEADYPERKGEVIGNPEFLSSTGNRSVILYRAG
jgi:hypothetical protein